MPGSGRSCWADASMIRLRQPALAHCGVISDTRHRPDCLRHRGVRLSVKRSLFAEMRRRNVIRAALLYIGAVWAFGQGLSQFSPAIGLPDWATRWFLVAAAI